MISINNKYSYPDDVLAEMKEESARNKEEIRKQIEESKKNIKIEETIKPKKKVKKYEYDPQKPWTWKFKRHDNKDNKDNKTNIKVNPNSPLAKKLSLITGDPNNSPLFDEDRNPIDSVAVMIQATGKIHGNVSNYSSKRGKAEENNRVHKKLSFDLNSIGDLRKVCDRERDYVHELQKILFSYYLIDIEKTGIALGKIDDKDGKIHELFKKEIGNGLNGRLDFFHWWEISSEDFEFIIDTIVGLHKGLEKVKEEINKKIENPEDKLLRVHSFYNGIHEHSPRNKKQ